MALIFCPLWQCAYFKWCTHQLSLLWKHYHYYTHFIITLQNALHRGRSIDSSNSNHSNNMLLLIWKCTYYYESFVHLVKSHSSHYWSCLPSKKDSSQDNHIDMYFVIPVFHIAFNVCAAREGEHSQPSLMAANLFIYSHFMDPCGIMSSD